MVKGLHRIPGMVKSLYIYIGCTALSLLSCFLGGSSVFAETVDYSVTIEPSLTLTIPTSSIVLNLDPSSKTFDSKNLNVTVGTNNKTGYKLTLSTPNDNTDLERDTSGDTTAISATIPTLDAGTYTESTFTANKWGYKINTNTAIPSIITTDYIPFTSGNTLMERDTAINHDETELSFASKIDYLQPAGAYSTTLQFNIVANPLVNYMQDLNPALCTTTPMTVVDKRDNQEYVIQRLADGNCWMMTNLNLGATALTTDLTSANTNLSNTITAATFNGWKKSSGTGTYTAGEYIPVSGTDSTSQTPYGTLYNYCATSAGTICTSSNSSDAQYDVCPKGWRLPTGGGSSSEFRTLYNQSAYNTLAKMRAPYTSGGAAFAFAGYFNAAAPVQQNIYGIYWSSTQYSNTNMYRLYLTTAGVYPDTNAVRYFGYSIRCILDDPRTISDITTMQEMSPQIAAKMNNGDTATLRDTRDNQDYTIAKINGNVWMTRNLAIGCNGTGSTYGSTITSKTLTSSDSNISAATWSTPTNSLTLGDSYDDPRMECSSTYGAWYNYAAATAGTITGTSNTTNATYNICPAGWRLPINTELYINSYKADYIPVAGGHYESGSATGYSYWYSSIANGNLRYIAFYDGTNINTSGGGYRNYGYYIRCIAK